MASVVSGYAPMHVTLQDLSSTECPLTSSAWVDSDNIGDTDDKDKFIPEGRYKLQKRNTHISKYLEKLKQQEKDELLQRSKEEELRNQTVSDAAFEIWYLYV